MLASCRRYQLSVVVTCAILVLQTAVSKADPDGFQSNGVDNVAAVILNVDTDGDDGYGLGIVVGYEWTYEGTTAAGALANANFSVTSTQIKLNENTTVVGTLDVSGNTDINGTLTVDGATTSINSGTVNVGSDGTGTTTIKSATTSINSETVTIGETTTGSSSKFQAAGGDLTIDDDGVSVEGETASGSAVRISGTRTLSGTSANVGVEISGDGKGDLLAPTGSNKATWADVLIRSASYVPRTSDVNVDDNGGLGSAIVVNDYGVQMVTPTLTSAGQTSNNSFGSGASNSSGTVNNDIGAGGSGSSVVNNDIGAGGSGGTVNNNIGSISSPSGTGNVTNVFGSNGSAAPGAVVTNNIGSGDGATTNNIGNGNDGTKVTMTASGASTTMENGVNTNRVTGGSGTGASVLANASTGTSGDSGIVLKGAKATRRATVDENGKLIVSDGDVEETTASLIITNGYDNSHGFIVNETQATMSGGTRSSSLTLNDYGATFSNSSNGDPIQVHGVADGTAPFDAVNVRQLEAGLAQSVALAGLPGIRPGAYNSIGIAFGAHGEGYAVALGGQHYIRDSLTLKYGVSTDLNNAKASYSANAGVGFSW